LAGRRRKFFPDLRGGDFAGLRIDNFVRRSIVGARASVLAAARGLGEAEAFAVHQQNMEVVGQAVEKRAGEPSAPNTEVHSSKGRFDVTMVEPRSYRWLNTSNSNSAPVVERGT